MDHCTPTVFDHLEFRGDLEATSVNLFRKECQNRSEALRPSRPRLMYSIFRSDCRLPATGGSADSLLRPTVFDYSTPTVFDLLFTIHCTPTIFDHSTPTVYDHCTPTVFDHCLLSPSYQLALSTPSQLRIVFIFTKLRPGLSVPQFPAPLTTTDPRLRPRPAPTA